MTSKTVDWNSIANQKSAKKNEDMVFLNAKNLPQTFLPSPQIVCYEAVYDEETKRNRPAKETGETGKARVQYLFYGLFISPEGTRSVKICCCGQMVAKGISSVQKTLSNLGLMSFVKVTSTGSALNTEYSVEGEKVTDKPIPLDIWDKLASDVAKLPTLEDMRDRLLGLKTDETPAVGMVANVASKNADLFNI